ncbi:MAG: hypothetical protein ACJAVJ_002509 [Planctomycetota bacterium]|jgi:hypothetical protein
MLKAMKTTYLVLFTPTALASCAALPLVVPGPGSPHLTFYDTVTGKPFGGVYFVTGDSLLRTKKWPYAK